MGSNVKAGRGSPGSPLTLSALLPLFICWSKLLIRKLQNIHLLTLLLMIEINGSNLMWQDCRMPPGKFAILATSRLPQSSAIICLVSRSYLSHYSEWVACSSIPEACLGLSQLTTRCKKSLLKTRD